MNREEAIEILKQDIPCEHDFDLIDAINMAIKALSQEQQSEWERDHEVLKAYADGQESMKPCEDAISRQAAVDVVQNWLDHDMGYSWEEKNIMRCAIVELENLPPVSVAEKVGEWIDTDNYYQRWKCSICGWHTRDAEPTYCPWCGSKNGKESVSIHETR